MANLFGDSDHPIIEMLIDGTWTDVSSRVRGDQKVVISRGRSSEQARPSAQRLNLTLDNSDGYFSTRYPGSVNYGKIGRNTQVRALAGRGDQHLRMPWDNEQGVIGASTADKAVLDVTGDIDVRVDMHPATWRPEFDMTLASKYSTTSDQRSWIMTLESDGKIAFLWSSAGTLATRIDVISTAAVPADSGRLAVRATLDVNNGSGGNTVTFYTAPDYSGPWTQLGSTVVNAGTTSVFASTASLRIGATDNTRGGIGNNSGFGGALYRFQMYNGIAGTLVADVNPNTPDLGDASWSDGLSTPNTWTLTGTPAVRITSFRVRFWGELTSLPKTSDRSGNNVTINALASGVLRRLSQGAKPLASPMYRNFKRTSPYLWCPLEDGSTATMVANIGDASLATLSAGTFVNATLGGDGPPGAASALAFTASTSRLTCRSTLTSLTAPAVYNVVFYVNLTALPASSKAFVNIDMFGQVARAEIGLSATAWELAIYDITGVTLATSSTSITSINPTSGWVGYNLRLADSGSNFTYSQRWDTIGVFGGGTGPTTVTGYNVAPPHTVRFTAENDTVYQDLNISHVYVSNVDLDLSDETFRDASAGYAGETAAGRLIRLAAEENVAMEVTGVYANTEAMGPQTSKTLPDLFAECWDADGGIGGDSRDSLALHYRTRVDMERRQDIELSWTADRHFSRELEAADDDLGFANDVTVTRSSSGSSANFVITDGNTSISDPPDGVGRYEVGYSLNAYTDERLQSIAGWIALAASWDQDRYPALGIAMHRSVVLADNDLFERLMALNLGDTATVIDFPDWMPPDDVPEIVQGYTETLSKFLWEIECAATPGGAYQAVPLLGSDAFPVRLDATTHSTGASLTTTATSVSLVTPSGSAVWVDSATYPSEFPISLVIDGEVVSLTAVTGTTSPQTGTITRSVNGVVKSHSPGALVRLARSFYIGR